GARGGGTGSARVARGRGWRGDLERRRAWKGVSVPHHHPPRRRRMTMLYLREEAAVDSSSRDTQRIDVLIGGAGFAGLALAIALRQGLGPAFSVTVADPALARAASDPRASALMAAPRPLFDTISAW